MKNTILSVISVIVLGGSVYAIVALAPQFIEQVGPRETKNFPVAPDFTLVDLSGGNVTLSDLRGRDVLLVFWTSWNDVSLDELKALDDYKAHFAPQTLEIIAVNSQESADVVRRVASRYGLSLTILLDTDGVVGEKYHIGVLPLAVFIEASGLEAKALVGPQTKEQIEAEIAKMHQ